MIHQWEHRAEAQMAKERDRRLDDLRRLDETEETNEMVIEETLDELEQLGERLSQAYALTEEPPSLAAIEYAEATVPTPVRSAADIERFNDGVRRRIAAAMAESSHAPSVGAWVRQMRQAANLDEAAAAKEAGVPLAAYRRVELGQMPVWRVQPKMLAALCRKLSIDGRSLLRWASASLLTTEHAAYGRVDLEGEERSQALDVAARDSRAKVRADFEQWRREFIAAYDGS